MINDEKVEVIDLVEIVKRQYPRLNNNLSLKEKNKRRRKTKEKRKAVQELFVSTLSDMILEEEDADRYC